LAERQLWELDVAGSNPVAPTISINYLRIKRVVGHKINTAFERKGLTITTTKNLSNDFNALLAKVGLVGKINWRKYIADEKRK